MYRKQRIQFSVLGVILALLLTSSTGWAGYKRINPPNPTDPMTAQIYQLDNGLTVYLTENHETPQFYAEIAVRAGSKHDPAESTGLAHYLEHMLFKGTQKIGTLDYEKEKPHLDRISELYEQRFRETDPAKRKAIYAEINKESQLAAQYAIPNEIDKLYKAMGGTNLNAHTWNEETVYQVNLPSNRLRQWATIESERFRSPVFRLFQPELEIVYEEKNRTLDNKDRIISYAVGKALYKNHPYGQQTTIGEVEHLKNPSLKNMYTFFETYYVPNNMAILISGDIDVQEAIRVIDASFSSWRPKALPRLREWKEKPLQEAERVTVKYKGEEYVLLAFRTADQNHPDAEALRLLDMTLDNSVAGLINLNLNQQQKVRQAGSNPQMMNDHGAQYLWGIPKKGQTLHEVEQFLLEQLDRVKKGEVGDWVLPAILTDFKKMQKTRLESNVGRVGMMREAFLSLQDWDRAVDEIPRMEKMTQQDIVRVARRYFGKDYVAGYRTDAQHEVPSIEKPQIDKIAIDPTRQSNFVKEILAMSVKEIEPVFVDANRDYKIVDYHDGVRLYYSRNPLNDLFSLTLSVDFGTSQDPKISVAAQLLDKSGAGKYSAEALKKEWYKLGTDFRISAGENETTVSISGLDEGFAPSLSLLMDLLKKPVADTTTLNELIKIILVSREDAKKDFRTISDALSRYHRYGKESYYLRMLPNEAIQKLTVDELHGVTKNLLGYKHTLSYAGSLPVEKVLEALKARHAISGTLQEPPPYGYLKTQSPEATEILFFNKEMAQAQVKIEFGDEDYNEANRPPIELYNSYFGGGMAGLVFQELREARALAYAVRANYATGGRKGDQNLMFGEIGCQTDKTPEAVEAFIDLLDNLPVSPERFEVTRLDLLNRYRTSKLGFRDVIGAVRSWERLGVPVDPRRGRFAQIQAADIDAMLKFHKEHLKSRTKLISIVGDKNKIEIERLRKNGRLIEVGLKDIFVF
ncbi:MAG: insulinase family protein [Candidatus Latescibacteria bacterium]|nr:insulinase family protein [Candidatus Latescibacterota bacterium]